MLGCVQLVHPQGDRHTSELREEDGHAEQKKSKMGQEALGVTEHLRCCNNTSCLRLCPWNMVTRIPADHANPSRGNAFIPHFGTQVQKVKMVKAWMETSDEGMSGHSGRRSGATWYARRSLPIHEIGMLCRWISSLSLHRGSPPGHPTERQCVGMDETEQLRQHINLGNSGAMRCSEHPHPMSGWFWRERGTAPLGDQTTQFSRPLNPTNLWYPTSAGLFPLGYMAEHPTESEGLRGT